MSERKKRLKEEEEELRERMEAEVDQLIGDAHHTIDPVSSFMISIVESQ